MAFVRKTDISASHYPPTVTSGFLGPPPPPQSPTYDPGHLAYFDTFRNEQVSRLRVRIEQFRPQVHLQNVIDGKR